MTEESAWERKEISGWRPDEASLLTKRARLAWRAPEPYSPSRIASISDIKRTKIERSSSSEIAFSFVKKCEVQVRSILRPAPAG
jgi:hypothetical protein